LESGYESQQGIRKTMEDAHVLIDDLRVTFPQLASADSLSPPLAFYAVYDGTQTFLHAHTHHVSHDMRGGV
jgi:hypothetical protein